MFAIFSDCHRPPWLLVAWGHFPCWPQPCCGSVWRTAQELIAVKQKFPAEALLGIFSWQLAAVGVPGQALPRVAPLCCPPGSGQQHRGSSPCWGRRFWGNARAQRPLAQETLGGHHRGAPRPGVWEGNGDTPGVRAGALPAQGAPAQEIPVQTPVTASLLPCSHHSAMKQTPKQPQK